jgi:hypothetical protein
MIKKLIFSTAICMHIAFLHAQVNVYSENSEKQEPEILISKDEPPARDVYFGLATGINYGGLFGLTAEFNVYKNLAVAGAVGVGSWGYKFFGDLRLYKNFPKGIYYAAGINYSTGIPEIELDLETISGTTQKVTMELKPVTNIDLGIGYAWRLGKRMRFNLEMGYAVDITSGDGYEVKGSQPELSDVSKKVMTIMKPGGFRFGLGFNIGL